MKYIMIFIGVIPLLYGMMMNYIITELNVYGFGFTLISLLFMVIWFSIGFAFARLKYSVLEIVLLCNLGYLVNYTLIVIQLIFLGRWFPGYVGLLSQFYLLPSIRIVRFISNTFGMFTLGTLVMILVFWLGAYLSNKQKVEYGTYHQDIRQ